MVETNDNNKKVIQTDENSKDGQYKCSKCGSTDISLDVSKGVLVCKFCKHEFEIEKVEGLVEDITNLKGEIIGSAAQDIKDDEDDIVTLKCSSCGAEVTINTLEKTQARCHWCRNTLSINKQIANGTIPDMVLPFKVTKEEAKTKIEEFVNKRKSFACPQFKKEFTAENILGVYLPYMIIDVNSHASFSGIGEKLVSTYSVEGDKGWENRYNVDVCEVEREFDLAIEGLCVEATEDKLDKKSKVKSNNIINSIMPFDIENCVKWNANYLKGYSSEKRDINMNQLSGIIDMQIKDVARFAANDLLDEYERGVKWNKENLSVIGKQCKVAYLPIWLYSYQQVFANKKYIHYVAVNARTKETMGSVPIDVKKFYLILSIMGICLLTGIVIPSMRFLIAIALLIFAVLIIGGGIIALNYNNVVKKHHHESETKKIISNAKKSEKFIKHLKGLSNARMTDANNRNVNG